MSPELKGNYCDRLTIMKDSLEVIRLLQTESNPGTPPRKSPLTPD